ncbi:ParB/RepB/Spo0J family partition protein [Soonwooa sp.]|uniref:ParB/RepB/Spo0J family partition protein n=1 Tax=Soonwooa sp. TaxID=1938592 RepID=UPI0028ACAF9D|nr:ParB/RepB/Spo0J family partition protein [Soonwooa sp.]
MSEFKEIELLKLVPSPTNPRTEFDTEALRELSLSIKEHGVLQAIIVRPHPESEANVDGVHEIVCGERRFRASVLAGMETIPASIRELNDDEVFELQIIENLERKDVHPMDEAIVFNRMIESGKYTVEDIAAKVAKNTSFVTQRLKLNDLIPELKEDFLKGEFGIGHAVLLARVSEERQKVAFEDSKSNWDPGYGTVKELKSELEDSELSLDDALFNINDHLLVPEAGKCSLCPKSSFANPNLFPEYQENICFDKSCFDKKTDEFKRIDLLNMIDRNPGMFFITSYVDDDTKKWIEIAEDNGKNVLKDWNEYSRTTSITEGAIEAFDLRRWKFDFIRLKTSSAVGEASPNKDPNSDLKLEILNIKERASRALELDREKIMQRINSDVIDNTEKDLIPARPLLLDETAALFVAMYEKGSSQFRQWMRDKFEINMMFNDSGESFMTFRNIPVLAEKEFMIMRAFIVFNLQSTSTLDYQKNTTTKAMYEYVKGLFPKEIELYTIEQDEVAAKRIKRSDARIEDLEKEISEREKLAENVSNDKVCRMCKKTDAIAIQEFGYPLMWKEGDLCSSCGLKMVQNED